VGCAHAIRKALGENEWRQICSHTNVRLLKHLVTIPRFFGLFDSVDQHQRAGSPPPSPAPQFFAKTIILPNADAIIFFPTQVVLFGLARGGIWRIPFLSKSPLCADFVEKLPLIPM
jgi:hypothetical protein